MISSSLKLGLSKEEVETFRRSLGREPTETEWAVIDAEWSEHNSYKSSKRLLRLFPTVGKRVVLGPGYDAGVVDIGGGLVATLHIESHNHPSAIDPYGGASTGIGGVLRDILSMGTRPVALLDILRFGDIRASPNSKWLLRNVVRGIADYGNCVGVPTVAGDIEFDESFETNCLVDVACLGVGEKTSIVLGEATHPGDIVVLVGGSTGRDGIGGAAFASKNLAAEPGTERSSVQVPDPFMKKLLIDSILETSATGLIRGMKDLGGGGLSTGLSEMASKGGVGIEVELGRVRVRESDMTPAEIMTSESQERMLLVLDPAKAPRAFEILEKYEVPSSIIGRVTSDGALRISWNGDKVVDIPAKVVAEAPLLNWETRKPRTRALKTVPENEPSVSESLLRLMEAPNIASKRWVFEQYDHEVGASTVLKPGMADAALMRLSTGSMLAVKADGNSKHAFLDPRRGAAGCVAEACRNVVAVGAEPVAMVDHLQFGDPSDPEVYWSFKESVHGMAEYCKGLELPVVGGKVSFYNEDSAGNPIKPSPIAMVLGLAKRPKPVGSFFKRTREHLLLVGKTEAELGGSEYYETVLGFRGGTVPVANPSADSKVYRAVLKLISSGLASAVHDCSKGGLAVAAAEMSTESGIGATLDISGVRGPELTAAEAMFSESHGRFLISSGEKTRIDEALSKAKIPFIFLGKTGGSSLAFSDGPRKLAMISTRTISRAWEAPLGRLLN